MASSVLDILKERSEKRRKLLCQELHISSSENLAGAIQIDTSLPLVAPLTSPFALTPSQSKGVNYRTDNSLRGIPNAANNEDEEEVYIDSAVFLKGTQSSNPHNDYLQHFVNTGYRPQNFIIDAGVDDRFSDCPKLQTLVKKKDEVIRLRATNPMYDYNFVFDVMRFDMILTSLHQDVNREISLFFFFFRLF